MVIWRVGSRAGQERPELGAHYTSYSPPRCPNISPFFGSQDQTTNILQEFGQRGKSQRMRMRRSKQRMALVGGCFCLSGGERERVELRPNGAEAGAPTSSSSFSLTLSTSKLNQCHCIYSTVNRMGKYRYKHSTQIQTFNTIQIQLLPPLSPLSPSLTPQKRKPNHSSYQVSNDLIRKIHILEIKW